MSWRPVRAPRDGRFGWALRASSGVSFAVSVAGAVVLARTTSVHADDASVATEPTESEPATSPERTSSTVLVNLVGRLGDDPVLGQLLEEWLGASEIDFVVKRPARLRAADLRSPGGDGPPVRMWIVAVSDERARLYFVEPESSRYLVRDVPAPTGFDEVGRERIVQIVLSSALAFIEEGASSSAEEVEQAMLDVETESEVAPLHPPEAPPVTPPLAPSPGPSAPPLAPRWRTNLAVGAGYGLSATGGGGIAHGPGLALGVGRTTDRLGVAVLGFGQRRWPREVTTERFRLKVRDVVLASAASVDLALTRALGWRTELGGGVQLVGIESLALTDAVVARGRTRDVRPFLLAGLGPRYRSRSLSLAAMTRLDMQPVGVRYELASGEERLAELTVPRLQPGVFVEATWHRSIAGGDGTP